MTVPLPSPLAPWPSKQPLRHEDGVNQLIHINICLVKLLLKNQLKGWYEEQEQVDQVRQIWKLTKSATVYSHRGDQGLPGMDTYGYSLKNVTTQATIVVVAPTSITFTCNGSEWHGAILTSWNSVRTSAGMQKGITHKSRICTDDALWLQGSTATSRAFPRIKCRYLKLPSKCSHSTLSKVEQCMARGWNQVELDILSA